MGFPVVTVAGNGFLSAGIRFQIKGVVYTGDASGHTPVDVLADSNAEQCAIDASLLKKLGANTVSVYYVDPSQGHDQCMQTLADHGIYVIASMATEYNYATMDMTGMDVSSNLGNSTWEMGVFHQYTAVMDSLAKYDNLLGLVVGNEIVDKSSQVDLAPYLKAATRDMKAYAIAREYRTIPIGYFTNKDDAWYQQLGEYLVCGGDEGDAVDFYGVNAFQWCGDSSFTASGYQALMSDLDGLGVPVFFSEDGCADGQTRTWQDQAAVFGSDMSSVWSGAIAYEWREQEVVTGYGLVSYTTPGVSKPTPLSNYYSLSSQWASATQNFDAPSTIATPPCPASTGANWPVDPSAALPTIAGLDFATIKAAGASATPTSTGPAISTSISTGRIRGGHRAKSSHSELSTGAKAGIGIGVAVGVALFLALLRWFLFSRRRASKSENPTANTTTPVSDVPANISNSTDGPSELPVQPSELAGPEAHIQAQELDSVAIYEAGRTMSPRERENETEKPFEYR